MGSRGREGALWPPSEQAPPLAAVLAIGGPSWGPPVAMAGLFAAEVAAELGALLVTPVHRSPVCGVVGPLLGEFGSGVLELGGRCAHATAGVCPKEAGLAGVVPVAAKERDLPALGAQDVQHRFGLRHRGGGGVLVAVRHDDNVAGPQVEDGTRHCIYGVVKGGAAAEHRGGGLEAGEPSGGGLAVAVDGVVEAGAHAAGEGGEGDLGRETLRLKALDVGVDCLADSPIPWRASSPRRRAGCSCYGGRRS